MLSIPAHAKSVWAGESGRPNTLWIIDGQLTEHHASRMLELSRETAPGLHRILLHPLPAPDYPTRDQRLATAVDRAAHGGLVSMSVGKPVPTPRTCTAIRRHPRTTFYIGDPAPNYYPAACTAPNIITVNGRPGPGIDIVEPTPSASESTIIVSSRRAERQRTNRKEPRG
jgi:hypothetical protein